ncbi:MAG: hypothetical protein U1E42_06490 [Rhodospirillales bacterium]
MSGLFRSRFSPMLTGLPMRLAIAVTLTALLWLVVAWSLLW